MKTYPCVVGNRIVELTEEQRAALERRQMSSEEKIAALLARIEDLEREVAATNAPLSNAVIARAEQLGIEVHDIRLSPVDPADLKGLISVKNHP